MLKRCVNIFCLFNYKLNYIIKEFRCNLKCFFYSYASFKSKFVNCLEQFFCCLDYVICIFYTIDNCIYYCLCSIYYYLKCFCNFYAVFYKEVVYYLECCLCKVKCFINIVEISYNHCYNCCKCTSCNYKCLFVCQSTVKKSIKSAIKHTVYCFKYVFKTTNLFKMCLKYFTGNSCCQFHCFFYRYTCIYKDFICDCYDIIKKYCDIVYIHYYVTYSVNYVGHYLICCIKCCIHISKCFVKLFKEYVVCINYKFKIFFNLVCVFYKGLE